MTAFTLRKLILAGGMLLTVWSCKQEGKETDTAVKGDSVAAPSQRQSAEPRALGCSGSLVQARKMDSILLNQMEVDPPSANKAIKAFTDYAYYCQNDSLSPIYLIKAGQVAKAISNYNQAKIVLEFCIENYPKFRDRPAALFLLAQLYDEDTHLNNETEARRIYEQIIKEYPKSDWALSAEGAIKFLGKTDEEMLREIQLIKK